MRAYENNFVYGRRLLKYIMGSAVAFCAAGLITKEMGASYTVFFVLTIAAFVAAFVTIYKYCRCPHCGKVIFLGVMAVTTCSRCKHDLVTGKKVKKSKR